MKERRSSEAVGKLARQQLDSTYERATNQNLVVEQAIQLLDRAMARGDSEAISLCAKNLERALQEQQRIHAVAVRAQIADMRINVADYTPALPEERLSPEHVEVPIETPAGSALLPVEVGATTAGDVCVEPQIDAPQLTLEPALAVQIAAPVVYVAVELPIELPPLAEQIAPAESTVAETLSQLSNELFEQPSLPFETPEEPVSPEPEAELLNLSSSSEPEQPSTQASTKEVTDQNQPPDDDDVEPVHKELEDLSLGDRQALHNAMTARREARVAKREAKAQAAEALGAMAGSQIVGSEHDIPLRLDLVGYMLGTAARPTEFSYSRAEVAQAKRHIEQGKTGRPPKRWLDRAHQLRGSASRGW
jgi:hypothetical protein